MNLENTGNGGVRQSTIQEFIEKLEKTSSSKKAPADIIQFVPKPRNFVKSNSRPDSIKFAVEYANSLDW